MLHVGAEVGHRRAAHAFDGRDPRGVEGVVVELGEQAVQGKSAASAQRHGRAGHRLLPLGAVGADGVFAYPSQPRKQFLHLVKG